MKLIEAYIQTCMVDKVIHALEENGVSKLTTIDIRVLGNKINPKSSKISLKQAETYRMMAKLEIICSKEDAGKTVDTIFKNAWTGNKDEGIIILSPIEKVIKIRTGKIERSAI